MAYFEMGLSTNVRNYNNVVYRHRFQTFYGLRFSPPLYLGYCQDHEGNIYNVPVGLVKVFVILLNCSKQTK